MRILLIHQYFLEEDEPGGSRFNEFTKLWTEQGFKVTVIAGMVHAYASEKRDEYKGKFFVEKKQGLVNVVRCYVSSSYNKSFRGRLWGYFSFVLSGLVASLFTLRSQKFDLVISTSPPLFVGVIGYITSRVRRIPWIFEVRDLWPESAIDTGVLKNNTVIRLAYWVEKFIYKKASKIVVLTPSFKISLIDKKKVPGNKIIEIPNAADFSSVDLLKSTFDREAFLEKHNWKGRFIVTYVGAHGVANQLDQLLDAALLLKDANVLFLLIGDGMEKKRLIERKEKESIENVLFLGPFPKPEIYKYILVADVGTSVLKNVETFKTVYSNKTFDYMACEKPILMGIDGVSRELVEYSESGLFVKPEDPHSFAEKTKLLIDQPRLKLQMGKNGYLFAKNNFDRRILSTKYLELMASLVDEV